jgi:hypothetical protein
MSTSAIAVRGSASQSDVQDYDAIVEVMNRYNEGVRTGSSAMMKPAFHEAATVFGYIEGKLLAGSIQMLFDWVDGNGLSHGLQSRIVSVSVQQTIAVVRVELENLSGKLAGDSGARLSDSFQFIKIDGTWKISQKSFHWY